MRWIYLSPHPDDAALCAGGLIFDQTRRGEEVEIWTLMAGVPQEADISKFARGMHAKWGTTGAKETITLRREEDRRAAALLGAMVVHFEFLDAIYRRRPDGSYLYEDPVGAAANPEDVELTARISRALLAALRQDDGIVCLLGVGDHVDHVLVRRGAELLGRPLTYVSDFPYILQHPTSAGEKTAGLAHHVEVISEPGLAAWTEAVLQYASQLAAVFGELEPRSTIEGYWAMDRGIRIWT